MKKSAKPPVVEYKTRASKLDLQLGPTRPPYGSMLKQPKPAKGTK